MNKVASKISKSEEHLRRCRTLSTAVGSTLSGPVPNADDLGTCNFVTLTNDDLWFVDGHDNFQYPPGQTPPWAANSTHKDALASAFVFEKTYSGSLSRILFEALFEARNATPQHFHFAAGAQFAVSKHTILSRPREFYAQLLRLARVSHKDQQCSQMPYVLERLWAYIFNRFNTVVEKKDISGPDFCHFSST